MAAFAIRISSITNGSIYALKPSDPSVRAIINEMIAARSNILTNIS